MNAHILEIEGRLFWQSNNDTFFCAISAFEFSELSTEQITALKFKLELILGVALARPVSLNDAEFYIAPSEGPIVLLSFGDQKIFTWMSIN